MKYAAILAGGKGIRFWPLSREEEPKQLLKIFGNYSLLQHTFKRIAKIIDKERIFIVTNKNYANAIKYQLKEFGCCDDNIIVEVSPKNTAASIGLIAKMIEAKDSDGILSVFPADHFIKEEKKFFRALATGFSLALKDQMAIFGIKPLRAESGYGYIQVNRNAVKEKHAFKVNRFIEKPKKALAAKLIKRKDIYWNGGIFIWKVPLLLRQIQQFMPALHAVLNETNKKRFEERWNKLQSISIDYGVVEKCQQNLYVIELDCGWTDLGNWSTIDFVLSRDKDNNAVEGDVLTIDTKNTTVWSSHHLTVTLGLRDMVVADTPDALLVCPKERAQEVSQVVNLLREKKRFEYMTPRLVNRPWGRYFVLNETEKYKTKWVEVFEGKRLSLQLHKKRAEHWIVVEGTAKVTIGNAIHYVRSNQSIYVPRGKKHRIENEKKERLVFIEVQTGAYLGEDDIERFHDDYERV